MASTDLRAPYDRWRLLVPAWSSSSNWRSTPQAPKRNPSLQHQSPSRCFHALRLPSLYDFEHDPSLFACCVHSHSSTMASPARHVRLAATVSTVALLSSLSGVAAATDVLKNGAWSDGSNCVDQPWGADYAYIYSCHGESNQQWQLTAEGLVRNNNNQCFELPESPDSDKLIIAPCDATRRQKWFFSDGQIKPQGSREHTGDWSMRIGYCVDASQPDGRLIMHGCHGGPNQKFSSPAFPMESQDIILVQGPWAEGRNCVDYDFTHGFAYVYQCHGQDNQRWSFTAKDELRVSGDKCLEYDDTNSVTVRTCSGIAKQKWVAQPDGRVQPKGYQATDGSFVSMDTKCLDASLDTNKLYLYDCIDGQANQKFISDVLKPKTQDLITVDGPWAAGQNCIDYNYDTNEAYVYSCHGRANQLWQLTADNQVRSMMNNMCLTLDAGEVNVRMTPCTADAGLQQWRATSDGQLRPLGYRSATGEWRSIATKCLSATTGSGVLAVATCDASTPSQKFRSRVLSSVRDHVYAGSNCMALSGSQVMAVACASVRAQIWEFTLSSELRVDGKCLTFQTAGQPTVSACDGSAAQKWKPGETSGTIVPRQAASQCLVWTAQSAMTTAKCDGSATQLFSSAVFSSIAGPTASLFEKTASLLDVVLEDKMLSSRVLTAAATVVEEADKALTASAAADATAARSYLLQFLFGTATLNDYSVPVKVLYETAKTKEFLLLTSVLVSAAQSKGKTLEAMLPFVQGFSNELYDARREVLWNRVLMENAAILEASADGSLDDFDLLGGALVAVCRQVPLDLTMCALAQYFQLMDQFMTLQSRLAVEGASAMSDRTLALAASVAKLYSQSPLAKSDKIWARIMTLFMFRAPFLDVLPEAVVARATSPDAYLPALLVYSFFGANNAVAAPLESQVRFLSDQITSFHYDKLLAMAEARDMDSLDAYMTSALSWLPLVGPINNYTVSDFPIIVEFIAPRVCDDMTRAPLSLCQLETFNDGLQSVLRFERQRRDNVVALDDVLEVDVRKKLDVIDQEKKQYEIISTLQTAANKIGTTINTEMANLKAQLAESTTQIRQDLERARNELRNELQVVGQQLMDAVDDNTRLLYNQIGTQAAAIRNDIYSSTQQLSQRLDDTGRAILGSIEDSKQELKYQIGAEAEKTRGFIDAKTNELKTHMSNEAGGLRQFIDAKSNQIIGVVREEGQSTRVFIDQKTNQIVGVVRDESEKTREVVRTESKAIQSHIDVKAAEIIGVVREEGQATRQVIVEKAADLKSHITYEANGIKDRVTALQDNITETMTTNYNNLYDMGTETQSLITKSTSEIKQDMRTGASKLGSINKASCVEAETAQSSFTVARGKYKDTLGELERDVEPTLEKLKDLGTRTSKLLKRLWLEKMIWAAASAVQVGMSIGNRVGAIAKAAKAGKLASKSKRQEFMSGALDGLGDLMENIAELKKIQVAQDEMKDVRSKLETTASNLIDLANAIPAADSTDPEKMVRFALVVTGEADQATVNEFVNKEYSSMQVNFRQSEVATIMRNVYEALEITCYNVEMVKDAESILTSKKGVQAITDCHDLSNSVGGVADRLRDAVNYMDDMRGYLAIMAASGMECSSAENVINSLSPSRSLLRRGLQQQQVDVASNEPYYTMTYAALTKLILDYQIQEAAFQFCKFYEYRNGGVAPPMCGSPTSRTYFTLGQVLEMRSWNPSTYNTVTVRGLLPTKPVYSAAHQRFYPHIDLARLRRGGPLYFSLPTWDIDWLKKYGWISPTVAADKVPSMYLESIVVYLPVKADAALGSLSTSSVSTAVRVETTDTQYLSPTSSNRTYLLPPQKFTTDATYGAASCLDSVVNPYDVAARCTKADGTSDVCVRTPGTSEIQNQKRLLPSLFSTWRITADFATSAGGALDVLVPKSNVDLSISNGTTTQQTVGDLHLIADVTIVQITGPIIQVEKEKMTIQTTLEAAATCCAADEYRASKSKCQKCSPGTIGAANGYACVPM